MTEKRGRSGVESSGRFSRVTLRQRLEGVVRNEKYREC